MKNRCCFHWGAKGEYITQKIKYMKLHTKGKDP